MSHAVAEEGEGRDLERGPPQPEAPGMYMATVEAGEPSAPPLQGVREAPVHVAWAGRWVASV